MLLSNITRYTYNKNRFIADRFSQRLEIAHKSRIELNSADAVYDFSKPSISISSNVCRVFLSDLTLDFLHSNSLGNHHLFKIIRLILSMLSTLELRPRFSPRFKKNVFSDR